MKKLLVVCAGAIFAMFCLTGCDNMTLENVWGTVKDTHSVVEAGVGQAIENGMISDSKAQELENLNNVLEGTGGLTESFYEDMQNIKQIKEGVENIEDTSSVGTVEKK